MKKSIAIFQILFSGLVLSGGNVLTAAELPLPALWYEFNGNLKPTCGDVNLTRWDTATNKADDDGEGGSYCEVRASLVNNAVTGCEPYSSSLGITDYASEGWTMAFSAKPSAVTNAVLFALGNRADNCWDGFALVSGGSNVLSLAKWTKNNQHTVYSSGRIEVPELNERLHSIVLTCSGLKAGTQWDRDIALYVDGVLRTSFTAQYTPMNQFQLFSVQGGVGNTGFVSGSDGIVDDFRIYGQVLTPEQVALLSIEYPVWPVADVNGVIPRHWLTFDGRFMNMGLLGLNIGGNEPTSSDFVEARESGRKAITGVQTYGGKIQYDGDFTFFCSAKMSKSANSVLFHLGYLGGDASGDSRSLALVRGAAVGSVRLVTMNRGGQDLRTLVETGISRPSGCYHSYAVVYSYSAKCVTLFVDGIDKGTANVDGYPSNQSWQFFSLCGGLGQSGLVTGEDGAVEDLRIYGSALPVEQIQTLATEFPFISEGFVVVVR